MRPVTRRLGTGLAEVVVGLALAGIIVAAAGGALAQHLRQIRAHRDQRDADDVVTLVRDVLRSELSHADPSPTLLGDTAVQLASIRLSAVACDQSASRLVLPGGAGWWSAPRTGDSLALLDTLVGVEWHSTIVSTGAQRPTAACPTGGTRVTAATAPPASVPATLLPARVWRVVRYVTYRAADGTWWLGERTCAPSCTSVQPVAGPLRSPSQAGFRVSLVLGLDGQPVALDLSARALIGQRAASIAARLPVPLR